MNPKKNQAATEVVPEHTIRCGGIIARVFRRQSNAGFVYRDFALSRSWTSMASKKQQHGTTFFADNEDDLLEAIRQTVAWLRSADIERTAVCDRG